MVSERRFNEERRFLFAEMLILQTKRRFCGGKNEK